MSRSSPSSQLRPSMALERALRFAAVGHRDQLRKGSSVPYVEHPMAVALILDRAGFDEELVIAGLLHDLVEDTNVTLEQIRLTFGERVATVVKACSEVKLDGQGRKRSWIDRKRSHIEAMSRSTDEVHAVVLADKMHNLISIQLDLIESRAVWENFKADRDQVLWYYETMIEACRSDDSRVAHLHVGCRDLLVEIVGMGR